MISWQLLVAIVLLAVGAPIVAAYLRAREVSFTKLYLVLVGVATPVTFVVFAMPESQVVNHQYTWFTVLGYAFPTPWVLLFGFAIGSFAFFCLWALIKYGDR